MMLLAIIFVTLLSVILTLSPSARLHSPEADYLWNHWLGFAVWLFSFLVAHLLSSKWIPERDPFLIPIAAILTGWGSLTVWRLNPELGFRQCLWIFAGMIIFILGMRLPSNLNFLRRYKYIWLTTALALTAATLIFGTNPLGFGPRMWLGCCGIYLQPSEPLKLLLIVYLAAYLADRAHLVLSKDDSSESVKSGQELKINQNTHQPFKTNSAVWFPLLAPTLVIVILALALLTIQRDLGTAFTILFLYSAIIYVITGNKKVLLISLILLIISIVGGFFLFDVVRLRIASWFNPWRDPSGSSYQIVQSLITVANGGFFGRGIGIGYPYLVPIAHSDFVFAAISEESGLVGAIGLLLILSLLVNRGLSIAISTPGVFRSFLAAGLTALLIAQGLLIIGGNLRLLPLTGITLPFLSYGGSSLIISLISVLFLLHISVHAEEEMYMKSTNPAPFLHLGVLFYAGLSICALALGYWTIYKSGDLLTRTDNPRRAINDRFVLRGAILDRNNKVINHTSGTPGSFIRKTDYPPLSNIVGYTDPTYGQSGLEASMDDYLRGLQGNPEIQVWWNHLLYGQPPQGLDLRLSLDLNLQKTVDEQLRGHKGALVLINANTGDILAMASAPTFDSNTLASSWEKLIENEKSPLFNRASLGLFNPGGILGALILGKASELGELPDFPEELSLNLDGELLDCIQTPSDMNWMQTIKNGCPFAVRELGQTIGMDALTQYFKQLGIYDSPQIRLPSASTSLAEQPGNPSEIALGKGQKVSPLQIARAASILSSGGTLPSLSFVTATNSLDKGWTILPKLDERLRILSPEIVRKITEGLADKDKPYWMSMAVSPPDPSNGLQSGIWLIAGTFPDTQGTPLTLALILEEDDSSTAVQIADAVFQSAFNP